MVILKQIMNCYANFFLMHFVRISSGKCIELLIVGLSVSLRVVPTKRPPYIELVHVKFFVVKYLLILCGVPNCPHHLTIVQNYDTVSFLCNKSHTVANRPLCAVYYKVNSTKHINKIYNFNVKEMFFRCLNAILA